MVRMIPERAIDKQRDVYMCFTDYTKAFDRVQPDKLLFLWKGHTSDLEPVLRPISLYKNRE